MLIKQGQQDRYLEAHPAWNIRFHLAEIELALKQDDDERAMTLADQWLPQLRQYKFRAYLPTLLHLKSQAQLALDQVDAARESLREARDIAEATGSRASFWPILFALSQLEADPTEAQSLRHQARELVETIAGHIGSPDLRASFLKLPTVRDLL